MSEMITKSVVKALTDSLKAKMPSIVKAYEDFPNQSQPLEFPSFSVFTQQPKFNAISPYVLRKIAIPENTEGKFEIIKCVGNYDFDIQLDIWCESKYQRAQIYEQYFAAFHSVYPTMGLNAKMNGYFDEYISFVQTNLKFIDDGEMSSQRNEWRIKIDILGSCRAIVRTMEHLMETIENNVSINDNLLDDAPAEIKQVI